MELDEVEFLEILQKFESATVSSLIELRQTQFRNSTEVITELKNRISEMRNEFGNSIKVLQSENARLLKKVGQKDEIIEGKEIEILGLRHQLRSMLVSKPTCENCSQMIVAPQSSASISRLHFFESYQNERENVQPSGTRPPNTSVSVVTGRKRSLVNTSIATSLDSESQPTTTQQPLKFYLSRRPSQKRRCLFDKNGRQFPLPIIKKSSTCLRSNNVDLETPERNETAAVNCVQPSPTEDDDNFSVQSAPTLTMADNSPASFARPIGLTSFSPPSQSFDASLAIHQAVNHSDLMERTCQPAESHPQKQTQSRASMKKGTSGICRRNHVHKPTCRHFQEDLPVKKVPVNFNSASVSEATGADLTLPSDFVVSESTFMDNRNESHLDVANKNAEEVNQDLPSIGGSPTKQCKLSVSSVHSDVTVKTSPSSSGDGGRLETRKLRKKFGINYFY